MVLVVDGKKIKSKGYNENAILIEKNEKCSLSSAFSMVGDALEKKSKIYKINGLKTSKKETPLMALL